MHLGYRLDSSTSTMGKLNFAQKSYTQKKKHEISTVNSCTTNSLPTVSALCPMFTLLKTTLWLWVKQNSVQRDRAVWMFHIKK